jgi:hypothetical protein
MADIANNEEWIARKAVVKLKRDRTRGHTEATGSAFSFVHWPFGIDTLGAGEGGGQPVTPG